MNFKKFFVPCNDPHKSNISCLIKPFNFPIMATLMVTVCRLSSQQPWWPWACPPPPPPCPPTAPPPPPTSDSLPDPEPASLKLAAPPTPSTPPL